MARGRWSFTEEQVAIEAYAVLMNREKAGRVLKKADLRGALVVPGIYREFLKLCLEHDTSRDLTHFKRGLLLVVKSIGTTRLSKKTKLSRLSLYRMLGPKGNPRLSNFLVLFKVLGLNFWIVDNDFKRKRPPVVRPKNMRLNEEMMDIMLKSNTQDDHDAIFNDDGVLDYDKWMKEWN